MSELDEVPREFSARLYDGRSAVPRPATVELDGPELVIRMGGTSAEIEHVALRAVRSVERVGTEVQLLLPEGVGGALESRLTVGDLRFEQAFDEARRRFGAGLAVGAQRLRQRLGWQGWLLIALAVVPIAYITYSALFPRLHGLVPVEQEVAFGDAVHRSIRGVYPAIESEPFDELIARMVTELQDPGLDYELRVELVDSDELNAVALPGGRILVFRGLVEAAPSAAALAGVLAHEIVHVERRHTLKSLLAAFGTVQFAANAVGGGIEGLEFAETLVETSSGLLILNHSREHETEADDLAVEKLIRAGRDPSGLAGFFRLLDDAAGGGRGVPEWFSTHPGTEGRIRRVERAAEGLPDAPAWMSAEEWSALQATLSR